jgi:hypothetical protein
MSNSYLVQLQGNEETYFRKLSLQQWYEAMALAVQSAFGGFAPTSGGYLIDCVPGDDPKTVDCATVAWVANASAQL